MLNRQWILDGPLKGIGNVSCSFKMSRTLPKLAFDVSQVPVPSAYIQLIE